MKINLVHEALTDDICLEKFMQLESEKNPAMLQLKV